MAGYGAIMEKAPVRQVESDNRGDTESIIHRNCLYAVQIKWFPVPTVLVPEKEISPISASHSSIRCGWLLSGIGFASSLRRIYSLSRCKPFLYHRLANSRAISLPFAFIFPHFFICSLNIFLNMVVSEFRFRVLAYGTKYM